MKNLRITVRFVLIIFFIVLLKTNLSARSVQNYSCIEYRDTYDRTVEWVFYKKKRINNIERVVNIHVANHKRKLAHRKEYIYNPVYGTLDKLRVFTNADQPFIETRYRYNNDLLRYKGESTVYTTKGNLKVIHEYNNGYFKGKLLYLEWIKYLDSVAPSQMLSKIRTVFNKRGQPETIQVYERQVSGKLSTPMELKMKILIYYKDFHADIQNTKTVHLLNQSLVYDVLNKVSGGRGKNYPPLTSGIYPYITPKIDYIITLNKEGLVNRYIKYFYHTNNTLKRVDKFVGLMNFFDFKSNFTTKFKKVSSEVYFYKLNSEQKKILKGLFRPATPEPAPYHPEPEIPADVIVKDLPKEDEVTTDFDAEFTKDLSILTEPQVEVEPEPADWNEGWRISIDNFSNEFVVKSNYLIGTTIDGKVICVNSETTGAGPRIIWTYDKYRAASVLLTNNLEETVYFASKSGSVVALNIPDGKELWSKQRVGYIKDKELFVDDTTNLYLISKDKELIVIDKRDGNIIQAIKDVGISSIPVSVQDTLFVGLDTGQFFPVSKKDWQPFEYEEPIELGEGTMVVGKPLLFPDNNIGIIYTNMDTLYVFDLTTGELMLDEPLLIGSASDVFSDGQGGLYISRKNGEISLYNLAEEGVPEVWRKIYGGYDAHLKMQNNRLVLTNSTKEIMIIDPNTGEKLGSYQDSLGKDIVSPALYENNFLYYSSRDGALVGVPFSL